MPKCGGRISGRRERLHVRDGYCFIEGIECRQTSPPARGDFPVASARSASCQLRKRRTSDRRKPLALLLRPALVGGRFCQVKSFEEGPAVEQGCLLEPTPGEGIGELPYIRDDRCGIEANICRAEYEIIDA
jgi:hypothetical protein